MVGAGCAPPARRLRLPEQACATSLPRLGGWVGEAEARKHPGATGAKQNALCRREGRGRKERGGGHTPPPSRTFFLPGAAPPPPPAAGRAAPRLATPSLRLQTHARERGTQGALTSREPRAERAARPINMVRGGGARGFHEGGGASDTPTNAGVSVDDPCLRQRSPGRGVVARRGAGLGALGAPQRTRRRFEERRASPRLSRKQPARRAYTRPPGHTAPAWCLPGLRACGGRAASSACVIEARARVLTPNPQARPSRHLFFYFCLTLRTPFLSPCAAAQTRHQGACGQRAGPGGRAAVEEM